MTTVLIILSVIAIGFIIFKLEYKTKKLNIPEAPYKIEPIEVLTPKKTVTKKAASVDVIKKATPKKSVQGKNQTNKKSKEF